MDGDQDQDHDADAIDCLHDAFTSNHLWKTSSLLEDPATYESALFAPLQLDVPSLTFNHPYASKETLDRQLRLPQLDAFEFGPLPELESLPESSASLETPLVEENEDVWQIALDLGPADKDLAFCSWDAFESSSHVERPTWYLTESGPEAFDATLAQDNGRIAAGRVVKSNVLLVSLWNLGLGRSSILFSFDRMSQTFTPAISDGRASGLSLRAAQSMSTQFVHTGNTFAYLRSFVEHTFASATSIPARVALATSVSSILSTFEDHVGQHAGKIGSLLQLQRLFEKPREILSYIARTVAAVKNAKTNEQLASILHHRLLEIEEGDEKVRQLSCEILRRVAKPTLDLLGEWVGIRQEQDPVPFPERGSFVAVDNDPEHTSEYVYRPEMMPKFISPEDGSTCFETGNSLRFLKLHHPGHPLSSLSKFGVQPPDLEWKFGWKDIDSIASKAKAFEQELRSAILSFAHDERPAQRPTHSAPESESRVTQKETDLEKYLEESVQLFDAPPDRLLSSLPDEIQVMTEQILTSPFTKTSAKTSTFSPPFSVTSTLSFRPLLAAQAKLVNATTLRLFFRSHQLQHHLTLQRQYQLLGDGVFSSRLASSLFDPDRESAERHKGRMRSGVHMGLQIGSRDNWPPASSELRLALMGVLSESYYSSALFCSTQAEGASTEQRREKDELPGQLNFAVRQLTEPEMEKVMDPYALHALDFLRLQYVPPSPLNLVITSSALNKYDYIFKFLLRLLRMLFVVAHLPRQYADAASCHFRMEAHHFVTVVSTYIFQTGITEHWDTFESYVTSLERRLAEEDAAKELGTRVVEGLACVREAHETCLDSILFSLLLRRRQRKIMALVEEIFELILLFAKKQHPDTKVEETVKDLYDKLRGKIRVFLSVCRQLTGKKGYGKGKGTAEENSLERLGVLLEMNGYFSKGSG